MSAVVAVTGAAGRIGRVVCEALAGAGHVVRAIDIVPEPQGLAASDYHCVDITAAALDDLLAGSSAVVHLAGHPNSADWAVVERLNIAGTRRVIEAAVRARVARFVFASSNHVAGYHPADVSFDDAIELRPDSPYGVSKVVGEAVLRYHCERFGIAGFALRIGSFRPTPTDARELRTWISPADMARLVLACLTAPVEGFTAVWGVSGNTRAGIDSAAWRRIGYAPQDDAERYIDDLREKGVDLNVVSAWPHLGGPFVRPPAQFFEEGI